MIRVLEIFGEPIGYGGQESYILNQLTHLNCNETIVFDFLTPYNCSNTSIMEYARNNSGQIICLGLDFMPGKSRELIRKPLRRYLSGQRYDIAHIHSGSTSVLAIAAQEAKRNGINKVIVHSHATVFSFGIKQKIIRYIYGKQMKKSVDLYCACSRDAARVRFLPAVQNEVKILSNGIDADMYSYSATTRKLIRNQVGIDENCYVIGQVGRLSKEKNQLFTLQVFAKLLENIPMSELWLVGNGSMEQTIREEAARIGVSDKVRFLGTTNKVGEVLSGMDAFILPSVYEGFGMALLEAECSGLPCVVSEAIPAEVIMDSALVSRLSLCDGPTKWASGLVGVKGARTNNVSMEISKSVFGVRHSSNQLAAVYGVHTQ